MKILRSAILRVTFLKNVTLYSKGKKIQSETFCNDIDIAFSLDEPREKLRKNNQYVD